MVVQAISALFFPTDACYIRCRTWRNWRTHTHTHTNTQTQTHTNTDPHAHACTRLDWWWLRSIRANMPCGWGGDLWLEKTKQNCTLVEEWTKPWTPAWRKQPHLPSPWHSADMLPDVSAQNSFSICFCFQIKYVPSCSFCSVLTTVHYLRCSREEKQSGNSNRWLASCNALLRDTVRLFWSAVALGEGSRGREGVWWGAGKEEDGQCCSTLSRPESHGRKYFWFNVGLWHTRIQRI
jgi:hypothetical protein